MNIFISLLHLNVVDQLRNAAEDKATKILREKLKFTTSAKSAGGKVRRGKYPCSVWLWERVVRATVRVRVL